MHDMPGTEGFESNISKAAGLLDHINDIAFDVTSMDDLQKRKQRWLDAGCDVMEIDHNWCCSIYTKDPNDNLVEFCLTKGAFTEADRLTALQQLTADEATFSQGSASVQGFESRPEK